MLILTRLVVVGGQVVNEGRAWISTGRFEHRTVLRACVSSHLTRPESPGGFCGPDARDSEACHRQGDKHPNADRDAVNGCFEEHGS
jgi:hypothetical protein